MVQKYTAHLLRRIIKSVHPCTLLMANFGKAEISLLFKPAARMVVLSREASKYNCERFLTMNVTRQSQRNALKSAALTQHSAHTNEYGQNGAHTVRLPVNAVEKQAFEPVFPYCRL